MKGYSTKDKIVTIIRLIILFVGGAAMLLIGLTGEKSIFIAIVGGVTIAYAVLIVLGIRDEQEIHNRQSKQMEEKRIAAQKAAENYRKEKKGEAQLNANRRNEETEKSALQRMDDSTKKGVEKYIKDTYGTTYITQEQLKKDKKALGKTELHVEEEKEQSSTDLQNIPPQSSDIRYSISSVEDRAFLSNEAEKLYSIRDPKTNKRFQVSSEMTQYMNFTELLRFYVNASGMESTDIYKRANLSKSVYSALFSKGHIPKKGTVVALAIALKLDLLETERLLMKAGYTFSNTIKGDLIAVYFINHKIYDIDKLNGALYEYGEPLLGSKAY